MWEKRAILLILLCPLAYATCGDGYCGTGEDLNKCKNDCNFLKVQGDKIVDSYGMPIELKGIHSKGFYDAPYRTYHAGIREYIYDNNATLIPMSEMVKNGIDVYIRNYSINSSYLSQLDDNIQNLLLRYAFTDADVDTLNNLGANVVRVHVRLWHIEKQPFEYNDAMLEHLDDHIETLGDNGVYSIIDLHAAGQNDMSHNAEYGYKLFTDDQMMDRVEAFWSLIAERYKDNAYVAGYDLINEPWAPDRQALHDFYQGLIDKIRSTGDNHILFLEIDQAIKEQHQIGGTYTDDNYAASFHFYKPHKVAMKFQPYPGYYWHDYLKKKTYWDKNNISTEIERLSNLPDFQGLPIFIGEFGAKINASENNIDSALAWSSDVMEVMNEKGMHFTYHLHKNHYPNTTSYLIPIPANWRPLKDLNHELIFNIGFRLDDVTETDRMRWHTDNFITPTGLHNTLLQGFAVCGNRICNPSEDYKNCPQDCFHPADTDEDGCIVMDELIPYINCWKSTLTEMPGCTLTGVIDALDMWKLGC